MPTFLLQKWRKIRNTFGASRAKSGHLSKTTDLSLASWITSSHWKNSISVAIFEPETARGKLFEVTSDHNLWAGETRLQPTCIFLNYIQVYRTLLKATFIRDLRFKIFVFLFRIRGFLNIKQNYINVNFLLWIILLDFITKILLLI